MSNEVPPKVHTAIRLMYAGFVVTALDLMLEPLILDWGVRDDAVR